MVGQSFVALFRQVHYSQDAAAVDLQPDLTQQPLDKSMPEISAQEVHLHQCDVLSNSETRHKTYGYWGGGWESFLWRWGEYIL